MKVTYFSFLTALLLGYLQIQAADPEAVYLFNSETFVCNSISTTNQPYMATLQTAGLTSINGATQLSLSFWIQISSISMLGLNEYADWLRVGLNNNGGTAGYTMLSIYYAPMTSLLYYQYNNTVNHYQTINFATTQWYYIYIGVDYGLQQGYAVLYTPLLSSKAETYYLVEAATEVTSSSTFTAATILQLGSSMNNNFCGTMYYFKVIANYYTTTEFSYYLMNNDALTLNQWVPFSENEGRQALDISGNPFYALFESAQGPYWSIRDYGVPGIVFNSTNQLLLMSSVPSFYATSTTLGVTIRYVLNLTKIPTCTATIFMRNISAKNLPFMVAIQGGTGILIVTFGSSSFNSNYALKVGTFYDMAHYYNSYMGKLGVDMYTFVNNQLAFNTTFYNIGDYIETGGDTIQIGSSSCSFEGFFFNWILFTGFPALIAEANSSSCVYINRNGSCVWSKNPSAISNCSIGTYPDTQIGFCIPCDNRCASCVSASGNNCTCATPYTNINATCTCPSVGYYYDPDGASCITCNETCMTCTNQTYLNCTSCYTGNYFMDNQCLTNCPGGVYGKIYWPDVYNLTCDPLNASQISNLDRIELGRNITSYIFYAVIFPLLGLKQGSQLWSLWDSCQLLYFYSFLNFRYQQQELFWVLDSFNFSMLQLMPNVPYKILNTTVPPVNTTKEILSMNMFVLKQTSVYFIYNAGPAVFILLIWIVLCFLILLPSEFLFKLCKATKVLAVFSWFNENWRMNVLLRIFLQFSPIFFFYALFQMFFTLFSDHFFLANYILAFVFLTITWVAIMVCAYYLRSGFTAIQQIQAQKEKKIKDKLEIQNEKTTHTNYPKTSSTLIDGFVLMKKHSKYFYMYMFLLKVLTCGLAVVIYPESGAIAQLILNVLLTSLMLLYDIFLFRMDNNVYYILQLIVRVAFWLLSISLFIMEFTSTYPGVLNVIGVILVLLILVVHLVSIIYAVPVGIRRLRDDYREWKESQMLKDNLQEGIAVELTVVTGAKRRRIRKPNDGSTSTTDVLALNPKLDREGDQYHNHTPDNTKEDDPSKAKRQKAAAEDNSHANFSYDPKRIKRQKFASSQANNPDASINSASKINDLSEMPSQFLLPDDASADRLKSSTSNRPESLIQNNSNQSGLVAVQKS